MVKKLSGETWKPFRFDGLQQMRNKYAISSNGRIAAYKKDVYEDGRILKGSITSGYNTLNIRAGGLSSTYYIHREVARLFLPKPPAKKKIVVHINHNRSDNRAKNLKWVTQEEAIAHQQKSPLRKAYKEVQQNRTTGLKLTIAQVRAMKNQLNNPKRKMTKKQIADKYGVSEMTLYRIQRGESWKKA